MSEALYFTHDGSPFFVTPLIGTLPCRIPVLPGGDGADTEPLEARTGKCPHRAEYLIGSGAVCGHHMADFFRIAGTTPRMTFPACSRRRVVTASTLSQQRSSFVPRAGSAAGTSRRER